MKFADRMTPMAVPKRKEGNCTGREVSELRGSSFVDLNHHCARRAPPRSVGGAGGVHQSGGGGGTAM